MNASNNLPGLNGPLTSLENFLALAGAVLVVAIIALVWLVFFRKKGRRIRKYRRHQRDRKNSTVRPTLAQTGGLPPPRDESHPPAKP